MINKTSAFTGEVRSVLEDGIIRYWLEKMQDPLGGYFTAFREDGSADTHADRSVMVSAGILWVLSAAYLQFRKKEYLIAATRANDYFLLHFVDHKFGGVYYTVTPDGIRSDTHKHIDAQAAAIYALTEFYAATGDEETLKTAENIYQIIEKEFALPEKGEYLLEKARDFSNLENSSVAESINEELELAEAFAALQSVSKKFDLSEPTTILLDNVLAKSNDAKGKMKCSWITLETAFLMENFELVDHVRPQSLKLWQAGCAEGPDHQCGNGCNGAGNSGEKCHGALVHALIANLYAWKYMGQDLASSGGLALWEQLKADAGLLHRKPFICARMCFEILGIFGK